MENTSYIIDSHQHVWQLSRGDYHWLTAELQPLYRDFLPNDLAINMQECKINATILVQAAATLNETQFLLDLASKHAFICGVVGWVDMTAKEAVMQIEALSGNPYFVGIRPMLQEIPDINWILQKEISPSFDAIQNLGLTFDALVNPIHLPNLIELLNRYPNLKMVINHGAKPKIKNNLFEPWASNIKKIAEYPQVYCKFSGLQTEIGPHGTWQQLLPYIDHLFYALGMSALCGVAIFRY